MVAFQFGVPYTGTISATQPGTWYFNNVPSDIGNYNGLIVPMITNKSSLNQGNLSYAFFSSSSDVEITPVDVSLLGQAVTITFFRPRPFQYGQVYNQGGGEIYPDFSSVPWVGDSITLPCSFDGGPFINTVLTVNRIDAYPYIRLLYDREVLAGTIKIGGNFGLTWFFSP